MDERRAVLRIGGDLQEFIGLLVLRRGGGHRDEEVAQAKFFGLGRLGRRVIFGGLAKIDDGPDSLGLEPGEVFQRRLAARADLLVHPKEVDDPGKILLRGLLSEGRRRHQAQRSKQSNLPFLHFFFPRWLAQSCWRTSIVWSTVIVG